jgi:hypothetical protein
MNAPHYVGRHRDDSNAGWARCQLRDDRLHTHGVVEIPKHAKPVCAA